MNSGEEEIIEGVRRVAEKNHIIISKELDEFQLTEQESFNLTRCAKTTQECLDIVAKLQKIQMEISLFSGRCSQDADMRSLYSRIAKNIQFAINNANKTEEEAMTAGTPPASLEK